MERYHEPRSPYIIGKIPHRAKKIPEAARVVLQWLRSATSMIGSQYITTEEVNQAFSKWREYTSTSPSLRHLGHYKAVAQGRSPLPREQDDKSLATKNRIMKVHTAVINACIQHQHVLDRWKKVASAMIEKIPGQPRIDKLRVIHLIEADLNLLLGVMWGRRLLRNKDRLLNQQQDQGQAEKQLTWRCSNG